MMQWLNYVDQKELNHCFRFNTDAKESLVVINSVLGCDLVLEKSKGQVNHLL